MKRIVVTAPVFACHMWNSSFPFCIAVRIKRNGAYATAAIGAVSFGVAGDGEANVVGSGVVASGVSGDVCVGSSIFAWS